MNGIENLCCCEYWHARGGGGGGREGGGGGMHIGTDIILAFTDPVLFWGTDEYLESNKNIDWNQCFLKEIKS